MLRIVIPVVVGSMSTSCAIFVEARQARVLRDTGDVEAQRLYVTGRLCSICIPAQEAHSIRTPDARATVRGLLIPTQLMGLIRYPVGTPIKYEAGHLSQLLVFG